MPKKRKMTSLLSVPLSRKLMNPSTNKLDEISNSSPSEILSGESSSQLKGFELLYHLPEIIYKIVQHSPIKIITPFVIPPTRSTHVIRTNLITKYNKSDTDKQLNQYQIKTLLGCGAFGKVYKAIGENGEIVAIKIYNKRLMRSR